MVLKRKKNKVAHGEIMNLTEKIISDKAFFLLARKKQKKQEEI